MNTDQLLAFLVYLPAFLFSLSIHEAAHAWTANKFGDSTAKQLGRITLNPIAHTDPIGTLIFPALAFFTGLPIIGWGKPVPVSIRNLKNPRKDNMWIAAAGPISNLLLAFLLGFGIKFLSGMESLSLTEFFKTTTGSYFLNLMIQGFFLNLGLAFFNLIPIHPLDGGSVMTGLLPQRMAYSFENFMTRYGFMIMLVVFFTGIYKVFIWVPVRFIASFFLK